MNLKTLLAGAFGGAVIVVAAFFIGTHSVTQTGGDFAGGIVPSQLFTANAGTNSVTPNLSNLLVNGAVSAGGVAAANQITVQYTGTTVYPGTSTVLGPLGAATSTTSTVVSFTSAGFTVGDSCEVFYALTNPTATWPVFLSANVTAVSGSLVSSTVSFQNGSSSQQTLNSSTLKVTCSHTGV
jgi:hypothetical protein